MAAAQHPVLSMYAALQCFPIVMYNQTTQRPPNHHKEMQTAVVWSCLLFIMSAQNHLARHSERGEEDKADRGRGWEDNIREWTGLEFGKSQKAAENREKWRKLVVKSSVVPH